MKGPRAIRRQTRLPRFLPVSLRSSSTYSAKRIVAYREENGPFEKAEELMNVRGIGEKSFLKLQPHVTLGSDKDKRKK